MEVISFLINFYFLGSVTDKNAQELINKPDIDGFLVGGASIKSDFTTIVEICNKN